MGQENAADDKPAVVGDMARVKFVLTGLPAEKHSFAGLIPTQNGFCSLTARSGLHRRGQSDQVCP